MGKQTVSSGKKQQFQQPQKSKRPLFIGAFVIIAAIVFVVVFLKPPAEVAANYFGDPVATPRSYVGRAVSVTAVETTIEDGKIKIPFSDVDKYSNIFFEVENSEGTLVPMMAYITPSGRLFVGSSMCEPCRGRTFTLADDKLVCDTCRTTYTIEDHQFLTGAVACGQYPPVYMSPVIEDGMIVISHEEVLNWRIRAQ